MIRTLAILGGIVLSACPSKPKTSASSEQPVASTKELAVTPSTELPKSLERAEIVFKGRVVSVGEAPNSVSGMLASYQTVTWKIESVLRGDAGLINTETVVRHLVVAKSKTARSDRPGLDPAMFAQGSEWLVLAKMEEGLVTCVSENDGVVAPSADLEARLIR